MTTVVSFKRCRLVSDQDAVFTRELSATRESSIVFDVERAETAKGCLDSFFSVISSIGGQDHLPDAVTIPSVGLRIDSYPSVYDLWYFPRSNSLYAIDCRNGELIYKSAA